MSTLRTIDVTKTYGDLLALSNLSIDLKDGELHGLIGPNGAGKTTFVNCITGRTPVTSGEIEYDGESITNRPPHEIARRGIFVVDQLVSVYESLTTSDNVLISLEAGGSGSHREAAGRLPGNSSDTSKAAQIESLLERVDLAAKADTTASSLSYGEKKRLMLVMGLALEPELLLLDEPVAGLNEEQSEAIMDIVSEMIDEEGIGVLLIEHDLNLVLDRCDRVTVLSNGEKIGEGTPDEITQNRAVRESYLGGQSSVDA